MTGSDLLSGELVIGIICTELAMKYASLLFFSVGEGKIFRRGKFLCVPRIPSVD